MTFFQVHKFQQVLHSFKSFTWIFFLSFCHNLWAAQDGIVIVDQAVIYADRQMSNPIGYVRKGRRITVGEIPRNKAQVYPIIVSGKIAFIKVRDISTARESFKSNELVAERFQNNTKDKFTTIYGANVFTYNSQIKLNNKNDKLENSDGVNWYGVGLNGTAIVNNWLDLNILFNYLQAQFEQEKFRALEIGVGVSGALFQKSRTTLKAKAQYLIVPYASYALGSLFRVNSNGQSMGGGLNLNYKFNREWSLDLSGGLYLMQLMSFKPPQPYNEINPSFIGTRFLLGLNYMF